MERVQSASSDLESRIAELENQDRRLQGFTARATELIEALRDAMRRAPPPSDHQSPYEATLVMPLHGDSESMALRRAQG
jgi:hypothetical protein